MYAIHRVPKTIGEAGEGFGIFTDSPLTDTKRLHWTTDAVEAHEIHNQLTKRFREVVDLALTGTAGSNSSGMEVVRRAHEIAFHASRWEIL